MKCKLRYQNAYLRNQILSRFADNALCMAAVTKGVVESGRVGALGEQIALAALLRLQEEGSIGGVRRQVPTHSKDKPRVGLYFRTDIEFARLSDNQRFVVWVTQRTSAENSDSYFWGLLNQLTQVWRKHAPHNPICVLLILGSDSYWKSWVFVKLGWNGKIRKSDNYSLWINQGNVAKKICYEN